MIRKEQIGDCTLYQGDCLEIMPTLGPVDAVVTDPPYGIGEKWGRQQVGKNGKSVLWDGSDDWDFKTEPERLNAAIALSKDAIIWGGNYYNLPPSRGYLVWDKGQRRFSNADSELAWCKSPITPRTFDMTRVDAFANQGEHKIHPTQKPTGLMLWCVEKTKGTVLDPFMGSGTTGVACAKLGRKFIGIELEEKYFDIAVERIRKAYDQPDLFVEPPTKPVQESLI